ncbi:SANT/Myb-like DNA-binding domain-containing protein [Piscirickettsia litoralis]|uniref:Uncharacterized protein n=1 Tax=Piscirickettsia litoralis TaxID=1891921 RepID=A0ABX3A299_9GAMM|nr:SANT/Myb-like DNA-binding domain-containing protein [Piscirickettsia litoralis]ODN41510.1 hypothetical protein BGC07_15490 [Piscirickettsia litoralis]
MNRSQWTQEEEQLMREYYPVKSVKEMQSLLPGRTKDQIYSKAKRMLLAGADGVEMAVKGTTEIDLTPEAVNTFLKTFNVVGLKLIVKSTPQAIAG